MAYPSIYRKNPFSELMDEKQPVRKEPLDKPVFGSDGAEFFFGVTALDGEFAVMADVGFVVNQPREDSIGAIGKITPLDIVEQGITRADFRGVRHHEL